MNLALLEDGLIVMIIGMGTVFIFLTIMIWAMDLNGRVLQIINKFFLRKCLLKRKLLRKMRRVIMMKKLHLQLPVQWQQQERNRLLKEG